MLQFIALFLAIVAFLAGMFAGCSMICFSQANKFSEIYDSMKDSISLSEIQVILTLCQQSHDGTYATVWNTAIQTAGERLEAYIKGEPYDGQ